MKKKLTLIGLVVLTLVALGLYLEYPRPLEGQLETVLDPAHVVVTVYRHGFSEPSDTIDLWLPDVSVMLESKSYFEKLCLAGLITQDFENARVEGVWIPLWGYSTYDGHKGGTANGLVIGQVNYGLVVQAYMSSNTQCVPDAIVKI